jgi:exosortase
MVADPFPRRPTPSPHTLVGIALFVAALAFAYAPTFRALVVQWSNDGNYSHGFLVIPFALYLVWRRRDALRRTAAQPWRWGIAVVVWSLLLLVVGVAAAELFLARVSVIGVVAGTILFTYGRRHLRILAFPLGFLLLMIPLPEILFNQLAFPLQLFASHVGELALRGAGVPVLRDGNVLELVSMRLEVAEACSGIRSIVSLLTFALILGEFEGRSGRRIALLACSTIPIAVGANAARVAATGLAAHVWGPAAADGFLHSSSGLLVFAAAVFALLMLNRTIVRLRPMPRRTAQ